jgi:SAM-dependent methyltransferase
MTANDTEGRPDERHRSAPQLWSGNPNPHLVSEVSGIAPGRALDVGAGEGADALWLAEQGWTVTATDFSAVALGRGRAEADKRGPDIGARITWVHGDVVADPLPSGPFDLVSVQFMHFPPEQRTPLFRRCIDAVVPGGTLLIVAHHPSDMDSGVRRPRLPEFFYTADELAALLDDRWTVLATDARPRTVDDPNGVPTTIHDTVLVARRR